uniref:Reverse transcriptase domain-containing protein n=1 Tax=Tanacetum cinerariifolium TaxID=118510 RepID=A0A699GKE1_TANCI|nr:reverse transcriptase domain-containing protein [Tanacetum cinerariifolium]
MRHLCHDSSVTRVISRGVPSRYYVTSCWPLFIGAYGCILVFMLLQGDGWCVPNIPSHGADPSTHVTIRVLTLFVVGLSAGLSTAFINLIAGLDKMVKAYYSQLQYHQQTQGVMSKTNPSWEENRLEQDGRNSTGNQRCCRYVPLGKKMESVFHISSCAVENQVKFATCTMLDAALTWWNGHVRTLGHDAAHAMTWETFKKKLTDKYCPKGEIKKLEIELWNLKVKGNDVGGYTQRFQELALMCTKFLSDETEKIDKYISGLPDNIHGNVMSTRPKTLDFAIELANDLMDQKLRTYAERQAENKRKLDNNNQDQQQLLKKQNVVQAYAVVFGEKKPYGGSKPLCPKCNYHHNGECAPKSDCPVLKNQCTEARGMVYALGGGETNHDLDNIEDDINA